VLYKSLVPNRCHKLLQKMRQKLGVPVTYNGFGDSMQPDDFSKVQISNMRCIISLVTCHKMDHFGESVYLHHIESLPLCVLGNATTKSILTSSKVLMGQEGVCKDPDETGSWLYGKWSTWTLPCVYLLPFWANESAPSERPRSCSSQSVQ